MKSRITAVTFAALLATAAALPVAAQTVQRDTGNMAYPAPVPQGQVGTTMGGRPADTGNMAYPASPNGIGATNTPSTGGGRVNPADTNGAQYQAPLPQGNIGTTVVK